MNEIPLLARRSIRCGRPVMAVFRQIVSLGEDLLEAAATGAIRKGDAELTRQGLLPSRRPLACVSIELLDPISARGCLQLPMRWKITQHPLLTDVHATLEARPVGGGDSEVEARLLHRPLRGAPEGFTAVTAQAFLDVVAESFSRRIHWATEARHRQGPGLSGLQYDLQGTASGQESG